MAQPTESWFQTLWDVLLCDDEACLGLLASAGGRIGAKVALVEGDTSAADALAYARTLFDLGLVAEAREVFTEILRVVFGWLEVAPSYALGSAQPAVA